MANDRLRRIGSLAQRVLGVVVALVAIGVGGLFVVLQTDWGGERNRFCPGVQLG